MIMKKNVFLLFITSLMSLTLVGCANNIVHRNDVSSRIQNDDVSGGSIANISKYSALGVGSVKHLNGQKQLLPRKTDDEVEPNDVSNTLIGVTNDGVVEELSLLTKENKPFDLENHTLCYYGDFESFIVVSILPFGLDAVPYLFNRHDVAQEEKDRGPETLYREIKELDLFLEYPFGYTTGNSKQYIDTSFIIHKASGYIYPFNRRNLYHNANNLDIHCWEENNDYYIYLGGDGTGIEETDFDRMIFFFKEDLINRNLIHERNNYIFYNNGFWLPTWGEGNRYLTYRVEYNENTRNLDVTVLTNPRVEGEYNFSMGFLTDKWGNTIVNNTAGTFFYNKATQKLVSIPEPNLSVENKVSERSFIDGDVWIGLDATTKQFIQCYTFMFEYEENWFRRYSRMTFFNQNLESDVQLTFDLEHEEKNGPISRFYGFSNSSADYGIGFVGFFNPPLFKYDENKYFGYTKDDNGANIYSVELDENGYYKVDGQQFLRRIETRKDLCLVYANEHFYYLLESKVHKMDPFNDFSDEIILNDSNYFIKSLDVDKMGNIIFDGIDFTMAEVHGYITPNDEITFEISSSSSNYSIISISPINR